MKRTTSLVLLLLSTFLLPIGGAHALIDDTHRSPVLTPDQEKAMILERRAYIRDAARFEYVQAVNFKAAVFAAVLEQDRINDEEQAREERSGSPARVGEPSSGRCGGDLPPCRVMNRESGGNLTIYTGGCYYPVGYTGVNECNPNSTASGKWQFLRSTWAKFMGYINAADAPEDVQDAKARLTWAGGDGCSHWDEC